MTAKVPPGRLDNSPPVAVLLPVVIDTRSHCAARSGRHEAANGGRGTTGDSRRRISAGLVSGVYHTSRLKVPQAAGLASRGQLNSNIPDEPPKSESDVVYWVVVVY